MPNRHGLTARAYMFTALALTGFTCAASAEQIHSTVVLEIAQDGVAEFLEVMAEAVPDTRAFDGCQHFSVLVDNANPQRVVFYSIWDSKEHQQAYSGWRAETGFREILDQYVVSAEVSYYTSLPE